MRLPSIESWITSTKKPTFPIKTLAGSITRQVKRTIGATLVRIPLVQQQPRNEAYYTLGKGEVLQLDISGYEAFTVRAIGNSPIRLGNGELAMKVSIEQSLDERAYGIAMRSKGEENVIRSQKKVGYMTIPVMRDETVNFYSRNEMDTVDPNMPLLRATFFVFGVRQERSSDVATQVDRLIQRKLAQ